MLSALQPGPSNKGSLVVHYVWTFCCPRDTFAVRFPGSQTWRCLGFECKRFIAQVFGIDTHGEVQDAEIEQRSLWTEMGPEHSLRSFYRALCRETRGRA